MLQYTIKIPIKATVYVTLDAESENEALQKATSMDFQFQLKESLDRQIILTWDVKTQQAVIIGKLYGRWAKRWPCRM